MNTNWERGDWSAPLQKGTGVLVDGKINRSQQDKMHHGVQQALSKEPVKRGECPTVFSVCAASSAVLCAVLGHTI